jgi:hypothetical protein
MARKPSSRSRIELLTEKWEPAIKAAFLGGVRDITKRAELSQIVARLERGDISGAIDAVHLDPAVFRSLEDAIAGAFKAGGDSQIASLPRLANPSGGEFVVRFDARNLRAEEWLRKHSSSLITRINAEQQASIRQILTEGMVTGRNPRDVALEMVGRINRVTGRREGGVIGLSAPQKEYVRTAREELTGGNVSELSNYLSRKRRDRRFDAYVNRAIKDGTPIPGDVINKMVGRYSDRLLDLRAETIARTEMMAALNESSLHAMNQAVESGAVKAETVTKTWHTARDPRVRDSHAAQDREVVGLSATFSNGLAYPCDPNGSPIETANCRCWMETKIDFTAALIEEELALAGLS